MKDPSIAPCRRDGTPRRRLRPLEVQNGYGGSAEKLEYLTPREAAGCVPMNQGSCTKTWPLWQAQVEADPLYKDDLM